MSTLKLTSNASGTGVFTINSPNSDTDRTLTFPDKAGVITAGSGSVIQFVQNVPQLARFSTTSTTYQATGFSVDITPQYSTSAIYVMGTMLVLNSVNYTWVDVRRNGTQFLSTSNSSQMGIGYYGGTVWDTRSFCIKDEPNTTSQVTYELYIRDHGSGGTCYLGASTTVPTGTQSNNVYLYALEVVQ